jgi:hypothetical protein
MDPKRLLIRIAYWLAVLIVSLLLVFALVLLFESLDSSNVDNGGVIPVLPLLGH